MHSEFNKIILPGQEFSWAAHQFRSRVAVEVDGQAHSFAWVEGQANCLANALRALGLQTNDRVAVLLDNSVESVVTVIAATKAALTLVALNARQTIDEHLAILIDCEPRALIVGKAYQVEADSICAAGWRGDLIGVGWEPPRGHLYSAVNAQAHDSAPANPVEPQDYFPRIAYTSGSTGRPKGVVYSYASGRARLANFFATTEFALGVGDAMLHSAPITHAAGNYLMPYFLRGARAVILPRFDPALVAASITRSSINHMFLVPTMLRRLLALPSAQLDQVATLDRIFYGAAPTSRDLIEAALDRLGPVLRQHYGMTEAPQPLAILYPHEHEERDAQGQRRLIDTCGRPVFGVTLRIVRPDGSIADTGETGEVTIRSEGACAVRFWRSPELEAEAIRDGWYHSGDLGSIDGEGYLRIEGRVKDMIISGGFNIYSGEVERALESHPEIVEAAVFGTPDPEWGEVVTAWLAVRNTNIDPAKMVADSCGGLASYKRPRIIRTVTSLPRNANGKIDKPAIRRSVAVADATKDVSLAP